MGERDTLTSVAARFDTTPSELTKLNRMGSAFIYPGQQLWVPAKGEGAAGDGKSESTGSETTQDNEGQDDLPPEEKGIAQGYNTSMHNTRENVFFFFFLLK